MIKTTILSGAEQKVEFSGNHTHYWVQNLSDGDVLASMSSGITEGADNVLTIPAGGVSYVRDDKGASSVYLLGTGKVQIYGKSNEFCPFKSASGGGGSVGVAIECILDVTGNAETELSHPITDYDLILITAYYEYSNGSISQSVSLSINPNNITNFPVIINLADSSTNYNIGKFTTDKTFSGSSTVYNYQVYGIKGVK